MHLVCICDKRTRRQTAILFIFESRYNISTLGINQKKRCLLGASQTIHAKFFLLLVLNLFFCHAKTRHNRILHVVIIDARRNQLLARIFLCGHRHCCLQVQHKLQLQAIVHLSQIKLCAARLIVDDLYVERAILLCKIHAVNSSAKRQLQPFLNWKRHGIAACLSKVHLVPCLLIRAVLPLMTERPERAVCHTADTARHGFVSGTAVKDGCLILLHRLCHALLDEAVSLGSINLSPI